MAGKFDAVIKIIALNTKPPLCVNKEFVNSRKSDKSYA